MKFSGSGPALLDACTLTTQLAQIEDACAPYKAPPVQYDLFDKRGMYREYPFHTNISGYLANSEGFRRATSPALNTYTLKGLDTFLVPFPDLIMDRDIIPGLESRPFFLFHQIILDKFHDFRLVHHFGFLRLCLCLHQTHSACIKGVQM